MHVYDDIILFSNRLNLDYSYLENYGKIPLRTHEGQLRSANSYLTFFYLPAFSIFLSQMGGTEGSSLHLRICHFFLLVLN